MIKLRFRTLDGIRKTKTFKTVAGARKAAHDWVGKDADVGIGYAVSTDGVVTVSVDGATLDDIFGEPKVAEKKDEPRKFVAKRSGPDSYDLYCGDPVPANKFGRVFEAYEVHVGDERDGWALSFEWPELGYTDDHYSTLKAALAYARWAVEGYFEYSAEEARAEQEAEGAWLRHAERQTNDDFAFEEYERSRGLI